MAWLREIAWPFGVAIFDSEACAGDGHESVSGAPGDEVIRAIH
jgi:hypothetical protein